MCPAELKIGRLNNSESVGPPGATHVLTTLPAISTRRAVPSGAPMNVKPKRATNGFQIVVPFGWMVCASGRMLASTTRVETKDSASLVLVLTSSSFPRDCPVRWPSLSDGRR
jgi:hypothetical protein